MKSNSATLEKVKFPFTKIWMKLEGIVLSKLSEQILMFSFVGYEEIAREYTIPSGRKNVSSVICELRLQRW